MTRGESLTARLTPVTLVVGKGGVGKTTVAAALGGAFAARGDRTLVVTTDPSGTLLSAFGRPITPTAAPVSLEAASRARGTLDAWAVDTARVRDDFLAGWREPITQILDRGTYLDVDDVRALVDATLPGADEIFSLLAIGDVLGRTTNAYDRVVIDTAPTGHTMRLLNLPQSFAAIVRLLDAMQEKHRFMVRALTHRYRADAADAMIADLRLRVEALQLALTDPNRTTAILVVRPEAVVVAESVRYLAALGESHIAVSAILINTWHATDAEATAISPMRARAGAIPLYTIGSIDTNIVGALLESTRPFRRTDEKAATIEQSIYSARSYTPASLMRPLTIVAGKGGVGKTTVACALALAAAGAGQRTLLVSTDPAPSVGDALALEIGDAETPVPGVPDLAARQMDATRAFATLRDQYQERIDEVFANITGRGMDLAHDREILRDLLALAPPGIDEVYALTIIGEAIDEGRFERVVIDPAPTGHLLRLLDMPALAVAWSHQLMRLMLKYKEVVGLGDAAQELLTFARRTKALDLRLRDSGAATAIIVALDEPLVRGETERLSRALRDRGVAIGAVVWNRTSRAPAPLPTDGPVLQLCAPVAVPAPIGADAIRRWSSQWGGIADRA